MSNSLNDDLTGRAVIFKQKYLSVPAVEHPYLVKGGFGAEAGTIGTALSGHFLSDGEVARMEGYMVERYATDDEIAMVVAIRGLIDDPQSPFFGLIQHESKSS